MSSGFCFHFNARAFTSITRLIFRSAVCRLPEFIDRSPVFPSLDFPESNFQEQWRPLTASAVQIAICGSSWPAQKPASQNSFLLVCILNYLHCKAYAVVESRAEKKEKGKKNSSACNHNGRGMICSVSGEYSSALYITGC